ncbi:MULTISPECIES: plastocyanin/azurin family copper-binding protein [unclassified Nostoc]|uniref:plastocyanin/azurin family copper-binding protein n=1 Tax=unclassified Nostoc TaxID=2593658 RepID=UPI002AD4F0EE|nr:plastocyanin/azurin family copper-binding protein [Nostoc sp. DedQUE03]MDZ7973618.1 plastocyanin/azurin family copper-binding protein [Nostoc sp. DedQUE03]MDZ8049643.1 plastocyanin/azurin family copper-binding protein [Nostoc sp. DedQUE02]
MKVYNYLYQIVITSLTFPNTLWLQILQSNYVILTLFLTLNFIAVNPAMAANVSGDLLKQPATEITVSLGNSANELKFEPNHLAFEVGQRYQLRLNNPSQLKHYFTAKDFADGIWTQKVEAGKVEIKGAIHELELKPGAEAEWVFVPLKSGTYGLRCTIPGHTEAGMTGEIAIKN